MCLAQASYSTVFMFQAAFQLRNMFKCVAQLKSTATVSTVKVTGPSYACGPTSFHAKAFVYS